MKDFFWLSTTSCSSRRLA